MAASALALLAASCSGDDSDAEVSTTSSAPSTSTEVTTIPATTEPDTTVATTTEPPATTTEPAPPSTSAAPTTTEPDDDLIIVDDMADMPTECVDLLSEFLVLVEPLVAEIDWTTASLNDFEAVLTDNEDTFSTYTDNTEAAGCDQFDFDSSQRSLEAMLELANDVAPGTVAWLETLSAFDNDDPDAEGPTDCAAALALMDELLPKYPKIGDVPISQINAMSTALDVVNEDCTPEQADEFYNRDDVVNFIS